MLVYLHLILHALKGHSPREVIVQFIIRLREQIYFKFFNALYLICSQIYFKLIMTFDRTL